MEDFSLIILCRGSRHLLPLTLDTLKPQTGSFEVILLDGEGSGRLPELARLYPDLKIKIKDASHRPLPAMMNDGVQLAAGKYIQFLQPGDRYISQHGISFLTDLIQPAPPLITARGVSLETQSHWLLKQKVLELGGFDEGLHFRPMMDLLFRFQNQGVHPVACRRALVDCVLDSSINIAETCKILYRHFGLWHTLKHLFNQRQLFHRTAAFLKQSFWKD